MSIKRVSWPAAAEWKEVLKRTWRESGDDNVGLLAAGVAFYGFLAFVPLLASVVLTYGLMADPATVAEHIQALARTLPREAAAIVGDQLQSVTGTKSGAKGFGLLLAIGIALYGASKGAGAIITALNVAYEVKETRSFVRRTALALAMTAGMVVVVLFAAAAISALGFLEHLLPFSSPIVHFALKLVLWAVAAAAVSLGIALVYRYAPNRPDAPWAWVTPGSAAATLVWLLATLGFGLYVSNFGNYNATYGSLGGVVVFLTWLYLTSYILLMGGELNSELERQQAAKDPALAAQAGPQPGNEAEPPARDNEDAREADTWSEPSAVPAVQRRDAVPGAAPAQRHAAGADSKAGLAFLLGGGAALGFSLWRSRRAPSGGDARYYRGPETDRNANFRIEPAQ